VIIYYPRKSSIPVEVEIVVTYDGNECDVVYTHKDVLLTYSLLGESEIAIEFAKDLRANGVKFASFATDDITELVSRVTDPTVQSTPLEYADALKFGSAMISLTHQYQTNKSVSNDCRVWRFSQANGALFLFRYQHNAAAAIVA